jgi:hypothetical protein
MARPYPSGERSKPSTAERRRVKLRSALTRARARATMETPSQNCGEEHLARWITLKKASAPTTERT